MEFKIKYQNSIKEEFEALVNRASHSTIKEFDELCKLCKKFVDEVDEAVKEGKSKKGMNY